MHFTVSKFHQVRKLTNSFPQKILLSCKINIKTKKSPENLSLKFTWLSILIFIVFLFQISSINLTSYFSITFLFIYILYILYIVIYATSRPLSQFKDQRVTFEWLDYLDVESFD